MSVTASRMWRSIARPHSRWSGFGRAERMRLPSPAASTTHARGVAVTGEGLPLARGRGIEPRLPVPKAGVLPIGRPPTGTSSLLSKYAYQLNCFAVRRQWQLAQRTSHFAISPRILGGWRSGDLADVGDVVDGDEPVVGAVVEPHRRRTAAGGGDELTVEAAAIAEAHVHVMAFQVTKRSKKLRGHLHLPL